MVPLEGVSSGMISKRGTPARLEAQSLESLSRASSVESGCSSSLNQWPADPVTSPPLLESLGASVSRRGTPSVLPSQSLSRSSSRDTLGGAPGSTTERPSAGVMSHGGTPARIAAQSLESLSPASTEHINSQVQPEEIPSRAYLGPQVEDIKEDEPKVESLAEHGACTEDQEEPSPPDTSTLLAYGTSAGEDRTSQMEELPEEFPLAQGTMGAERYSSCFKVSNRFAALEAEEQAIIFEGAYCGSLSQGDVAEDEAEEEAERNTWEQESIHCALDQFAPEAEQSTIFEREEDHVELADADMTAHEAAGEAEGTVDMDSSACRAVLPKRQSKSAKKKKSKRGGTRKAEKETRAEDPIAVAAQSQRADVDGCGRDGAHELPKAEDILSHIQSLLSNLSEDNDAPDLEEVSRKTGVKNDELRAEEAELNSPEAEPTGPCRESRWQELKTFSEQLSADAPEQVCVRAAETEGSPSGADMQSAAKPPLEGAKAEQLALFTARLNQQAIAKHLKMSTARRLVLAVPVEPSLRVECADVLQVQLGALLLCEAVDGTGWAFGTVLAPNCLAGQRGCFRCEHMQPVRVDARRQLIGEWFELAPGTWKEVEALNKSEHRLRRKALHNRMSIARAAWEAKSSAAVR